MIASVAWGAFVGTIYAATCVFAGAAICALDSRVASPLRGWAVGIALRFGLGHLVLGSVWTFMALGSAFEARLVGPVCTSAILIGLAAWTRRGTGETGLAIRSLRPRWDSSIAAVFAALVLARALAPPGNDDALRGYLVTSRVVAETHQLTLHPFNTFVAWPLLAEMNVAVPLLLANETAATVFDGWGGLVFLLALRGLATAAGLGRMGSAVALLALSSSSAFLGLVGAGKVDIAGALYGVLAATVALRKPAGVREFALTGLFFGSALAVKYSNLFLLPGLVVLLSRENGLGRWRPLASFAMSAAFAFAPQLWKNFCLTGNPVAPFLGGLFGTAHWYWTDSLAGDIGGPPDFSWVHRLFFPLFLTFGGHVGMLGTISPLFLGFLPLLLRLKLEDPRPRVLAWSALAIFAAWFVTYPWGLIFPRFHFVPLALLSVTVGALAEIASRAPRFRSAVFLAVGLCSLVTIFDLRSTAYSLQYAAGSLTREQVYERHENARHWHALAGFLNREVAKEDRVFLEMPYGYFLRLDILLSSQTVEERQVAFESCAARERVIREGAFRWLVQPTEEFRWLVSTRPGCPIPSGFEVSSRTPVSILAVATPR